MSQAQRVAMPVYGIAALVFGAPLFLFPGRFLGFFEWEPVDPLLSRVLGAALLALAWACFRCWRAAGTFSGRTFAEMQVIFAALSGVGILRHLVVANYPLMVWIVFLLFAVFAAGWGYILLKPKPAIA